MKYLKILSILFLSLFLVMGCATFQKQDTISKEQLQELAEGTGAAKMRAFYGIDGEATGDLDDVDASLLNDLDMAIVIMADGLSYLYILDADSGATQDIPKVVTPSGTAGNKRWILSGKMSSTTDYEEVQLPIVEWSTDVAVAATGAFWFHIGERLDGMNLVYCHAEVITAGTTGSTNIMIHNLTDANDMLSAVLEVETGETGSDTADPGYTINTTYDDVAENDVIRIDIDAVSTTAPKGLIVTLGFEKPYTP